MSNFLCGKSKIPFELNPPHLGPIRTHNEKLSSTYSLVHIRVHDSRKGLDCDVKNFEKGFSDKNEETPAACCCDGDVLQWRREWRFVAGLFILGEVQCPSPLTIRVGDYGLFQCLIYHIVEKIGYLEENIKALWYKSGASAFDEFPYDIGYIEVGGGVNVANGDVGGPSLVLLKMGLILV
ncbi:hypothetical protein PIB30_092099 [Stylosanthes scabra]|uniref:Uncharacterized protein n=1 Tax=Stylosanthes scabra TaxID=79078 RepID=A0ABU6WY07_9FABA|nr:hypothetical protein [Stylosanthes scabra]